MILNLGRFKIDLSSPKTAFAVVAILFVMMIISAYCGKPEKKFIRTKSGRLTTKVPTRKVKAKKIVSKTSSLLPTKIKKMLVSKKNDKTLKLKTTKPSEKRVKKLLKKKRKQRKKNTTNSVSSTKSTPSKSTQSTQSTKSTKSTKSTLSSSSKVPLGSSVSEDGKKKKNRITKKYQQKNKKYKSSKKGRLETISENSFDTYSMIY